MRYDQWDYIIISIKIVLVFKVTPYMYEVFNDIIIFIKYILKVRLKVYMLVLIYGIEGSIMMKIWIYLREH